MENIRLIKNRLIDTRKNHLVKSALEIAKKVKKEEKLFIYIIFIDKRQRLRNKN